MAEPPQPPPAMDYQSSLFFSGSNWFLTGSHRVKQKAESVELGGLEDLRLVAEEAGHDDLGDVGRVRAPAGHTHHSEARKIWRASRQRGVYRQGRGSQVKKNRWPMMARERENRENRKSFSLWFYRLESWEVFWERRNRILEHKMFID